MKKSYLMIAAAAGLMLTACTSEDDYAAKNAALEQGDGAVLFDTYLSNNSTRAGYEGIMTTKTLQREGFGIMAYQGAIDKIGSAASEPDGKPNFMWNQYVYYEASNWKYNPLKYWPNETVKDKQGASSEDREGVSFYAYAPYVKVSNPDAEGTVYNNAAKEFVDFDGVTSTSVGLIGATKNNVAHAPKVYYKVACGYGKSGTDPVKESTLPSKSVDLLWGVSSGFMYHPVNAQSETKNSSDVYEDGTESITKTKGLPIEHMYKPALDERIKFDFKHALARIGLTVVGAFDQQAQGGTLDDKTRVTIDEITVTSDAFAIEGILNLDNTADSRALWEWGGIDDNTKFNVKVGSPTPTNNNQGQIRVSKETADEMNPELRFVETPLQFPKVAGVKATEQYVITENDYTSVSQPVFDWKKTYFSDVTNKKEPIAVELSATNIAWIPPTDYEVYTKVGNGYNKVTEWHINDANMVSLKATPIVKGEAASSTGTYYTKDSYHNYQKIENNDLYIEADKSKADVTIYTLAFGDAPVAKYTSANLYELTTKPRYFMVIPTTGDTPAPKEVSVAIKYHVTTYDSKVSSGVVDTENNIKQTVTLANFTNGKAYNLKIILGLTSVKIDADVTNWEVETVESNLPQNVE